MISAGKRRIRHTFAIAKLTIGMIHLGTLFPLADSHACFAEEDARERLGRHAEFFAPLVDRDGFFYIFKELVGELLEFAAAGHGYARHGRFRTLYDIPDHMSYASVFFVLKVEAPVDDGLDQFFQQGGTAEDLAGVEPFAVFEE